MITLTNGKDKVGIPDSWKELSPEQFINTIALWEQMIKTDRDVMDFRLKLLKTLTRYSRNKSYSSSDVVAENVNSNLYVLSSMLRFPLRPVYADTEVMEILSEDLRDALRVMFPFDISEADHIEQIKMVGERLKWYPSLNLNLGKNPLPELTIGRTIYLGPVFDINDYGIISTDMIAEEYVDAMEYIRLYQFSGNQEYLDKMISVLYREKRYEYDTFRNSRPKGFRTLPYATKLAVEKVFEYICHSISTHPAFEIIFSSVENKPGGSFSDIFFHLSEKGLGTRADIARWNLTDFFSAIARDVKNNVLGLRESGMDESKISKLTNIPVEMLLKI